MSSKLFKEINVRFPKSEEKLSRSFESCEKRGKFIRVSKEEYLEHLEIAKDDLVALKSDFNNQNWRWVITKSYYSIFHATNALLINKLGFYSKDHLCAIIALKKENLIPKNLYSELSNVYERFSDIFSFAMIFEARKLSQYDVHKWKELTEDDATVAKNFAQKFISFVEEECK